MPQDEFSSGGEYRNDKTSDASGLKPNNKKVEEIKWQTE